MQYRPSVFAEGTCEIGRHVMAPLTNQQVYFRHCGTRTARPILSVREEALNPAKRGDLAFRR
jgi:hypothetical protein